MAAALPGPGPGLGLVYQSADVEADIVNTPEEIIEIQQKQLSAAKQKIKIINPGRKNDNSKKFTPEELITLETIVKSLHDDHAKLIELFNKGVNRSADFMEYLEMTIKSPPTGGRRKHRTRRNKKQRKQRKHRTRKY